MRTEAPSGLVIYNLPRSRSPLRVASLGKPFLREVPPFLLALLRQLQNRLEIAWAMNVVFVHVLPWSRPAVFVEGNFLMANQARNVLPLFSSSSSRRWRGAPHQAVVLIVQIQRLNPHWRSLTRYSLGPRLLLLLDLYGRFSLPLPTLFCCNFLPRVTTGPPPPPRRFSPAFASRQLLLHPEIVVHVHTVLSLLLSLCLQLAATDCSSYCKWRAAVMGHAISKFSNRKV